MIEYSLKQKENEMNEDEYQHKLEVLEEMYLDQIREKEEHWDDLKDWLLDRDMQGALAAMRIIEEGIWKL